MVARLTLTDFRCYRLMRIETDGRPVVLTGPNGAGKTNLLEALSFLVPGRGLRRARLGEVARSPTGGPDPGERRPWAVAGRVATPGGVVEIGTGREAPAATERRERRMVRIDGRPAASQAVLADILNAVWLTPRMDRLFTEGATERRRFLDRLVFGFDPAHAGRVGAFGHALRERARLLRRSGRTDAGWLAALEDTMATTGVAVAAARSEVAQRLNEVCSRPSGPFPGATVAVQGTVEDWLHHGPALSAEDHFRECLAAARQADAEAGGAAVGPHRSDLRVRHLAKGLDAEQCSTGEQKALLIAIVLANAKSQADERGSLPLLLLDEVAAHLDERRRRALFEEICALGAQAWLTGTDAGIFAPLGLRAQWFRVDDATVTAAH